MCFASFHPFRSQKLLIVKSYQRKEKSYCYNDVYCKQYILKYWQLHPIYITSISEIMTILTVFWMLFRINSPILLIYIISSHNKLISLVDIQTSVKTKWFSVETNNNDAIRLCRIVSMLNRQNPFHGQKSYINYIQYAIAVCLKLLSYVLPLS